MKSVKIYSLWGWFNGSECKIAVANPANIFSSYLYIFSFYKFWIYLSISINFLFVLQNTIIFWDYILAQRILRTLNLSSSISTAVKYCYTSSRWGFSKIRIGSFMYFFISFIVWFCKISENNEIYGFYFPDKNFIISKTCCFWFPSNIESASSIIIILT